MPSELVPIKIPPGMYRNGTNYQSKGRYFDGDLVRFHVKTVRPVGGWLKTTTTNLGGPGRGMVTWRPSNIQRLAAIGTPDKLKVWEGSAIFDITPAGFPAGNPDAFFGAGYGYAGYGNGPYGQTAQPGGSAAVIEATTWTLDTWGNHLLGCASHDAKLYKWTLDTGVPAALVTQAPTMRSFIVTAERIVLALGTAGDLRATQWCEIENETIWTPTALNAAGDYKLQTDGLIVTGRRARGTNLIFTTTDLHKATFVGQPYIYSFEQIADNCGLESPLAVQVVEGDAYWMGRNNFFVYRGRVKILPCEVYDYVFSDINLDQISKFSSGHLSAFSEIAFFYSSAGSTALNRCVVYNYAEDHWTIRPGLVRGCWEDASVFRNPMAAAEDGTLYDQETGYTADGTPITTGRFLKSGPVEIGDGDRVIEATSLVPDERTAGQMRLRFAQQFTPEGPVYNIGPVLVAPYTDVRLTGRQVAIQLESIVDADFRFGTQRLLVQPGGRR